MKLLFTLTASLLMAGSLMAQSLRTPDPVHSSGAFANTFTFANGSDVFLNVTRADTNNVKSTFLNFDVFSFTSDGFTDTFASGQIPDDSFKGDNTKHMSLNVDTSQVASFQTSTCTFSFVTFTFTCQPGPFGVIQLDFQQDGDFTARTISDSTFTFFQFSERTHQDSDSASAGVNGSVLGLAVNSGFGNIGTNRDTSISFSSNH